MRKKIEKIKKKYAGYISLKPINGVIFPSYIQNQTNKNFISNELKGAFYLSTNENEYSENRIVLNSLINDNNKIRGIVMMSAFSLPENKDLVKKLYKDLIKRKKELHFIFEDFSFKKRGDEENIEDYLMFKSKFFVGTKSTLNQLEKKFFINKNFKFI